MKVPFNNIETILFCDETKFYTTNGDHEDAIYYFGVSARKQQIALLDEKFKEVLLKHKVRSQVFHAKSVFKEKRPRVRLLNELCRIIIENSLQCFCYKYPKAKVFEPTKILNKFNSSIINFDKAEFQALFYFLTILNTFIRDEKPNLLRREIAMYFDRNVYGVNDTESFEFPSEYFVLNRMTFTERSNISLLGLPDLFGYIFRKAKISQNKAEFGDTSIESSPLTVNAYKCLLDINAAGLFHFIDITISTVEKSLKSLIK